MQARCVESTVKQFYEPLNEFMKSLGVNINIVCWLDAVRMHCTGVER